MKFTNQQRDKIIEGVYSGDITPHKLPEDLYTAIADHLKKGVYEGFGIESFDFGGPDTEMVAVLRENVYMFSGAKTYQECREFQELMISEDGVLPFKEFKELAVQKYELYNTTYLEAEYNTAILQSQNARAWQDIEQQKDDFPMLRYSAVMDENTSEICRQCDGVTLPVDDPFWDTYSPENHYQCRCLLEQLDEDHEEKAPPEDIEEPDEVFASNPGKTGEVFNKSHPYFDVADGDKDFAKNNFDLPIPDED